MPSPSHLLALLPCLLLTTALIAPSPASVNADDRLNNAQRLARGLPLAKPANLFTPSRVRPRQATGSDRPPQRVRTVCEAYNPTDFGVSCIAPGGNVDATGGSCCTDSPGGQFLLTQFWDGGLTAQGPAESWTVHGLWPDNCDGSYEEYCAPARERDNIRQILSDAGETDLLAYMNTYWKSNSGDDQSFWAHEWNKHGTCISSLETQCFVNYQDQVDLVTYFRKSVSTFQALPTYEWLASDGIVPSLDITYTRAEIDASLRKHFGREVVFKCRSGQLNEMWYQYNSVGGVASGELVPSDPVGSGTNCPTTGIRYVPKYVDPGVPSNTSPAPAGSAPTAVNARGYIYPVYEDGTYETNTCLISAGTWYKGGTCATYRTQPAPAGSPDGAFQVTSSRGLCLINSSTQQFQCVAGATQADAGVFTFDSRGRMRLVGGAVQAGDGFSSKQLPEGSTQVPVYLGLGNDYDYGLYFVPL